MRLFSDSKTIQYFSKQRIWNLLLMTGKETGFDFIFIIRNY
jgi:hypothetical protein